MSDLERFRLKLQAEAREKKLKTEAIRQLEKLDSLEKDMNKTKIIAENAEFCLSKAESVSGTDLLDEYWENQLKDYRRLENELLYQKTVTRKSLMEAGMKIPEKLNDFPSAKEINSDYPKTYTNTPKGYSPIFISKNTRFHRVSDNIWTSADAFGDKDNPIIVVPGDYYVLFSIEIDKYYFPAIFTDRWIPLTKNYLNETITLEQYCTSFLVEMRKI